MWVRCGVCVCVCVCVCRRRCYQMAMAGMPCIRVMQNGRAVCLNARCVVCCAPVAEGHHSAWRRAAAVLGCLGDVLPLCLMVLLKFSLGPDLCASGPCLGCDEAGTWAAEMLQFTATLRGAVGSGDPCGDSGQWYSFHSLPHCLGSMGSRTPSICLAGSLHFLTCFSQV